MDRKHEAKEIEDVRARLAERFPTLDGETIEAAVRMAHSEMADGVRDYVPVLVEHNAHDRLAEFAAHEEVAWVPRATSPDGTLHAHAGLREL